MKDNKKGKPVILHEVGGLAGLGIDLTEEDLQKLNEEKEEEEDE